jgi:hypothetical protein
MESKQTTAGFLKEHFESIVLSLTIIVALITMTGAFMVNRSDLQAINQEIKDFHGRLCTLEERYLQLIQKGNKE